MLLTDVLEVRGQTSAVVFVNNGLGVGNGPVIRCCNADCCASFPVNLSCAIIQLDIVGCGPSVCDRNAGCIAISNLAFYVFLTFLGRAVVCEPFGTSYCRINIAARICKVGATWSLVADGSTISKSICLCGIRVLQLHVVYGEIAELRLIFKLFCSFL